jgi:hypothetical protein
VNRRSSIIRDVGKIVDTEPVKEAGDMIETQNSGCIGRYDVLDRPNCVFLGVAI